MCMAGKKNRRCRMAANCNRPVSPAGDHRGRHPIQPPHTRSPHLQSSSAIMTPPNRISAFHGNMRRSIASLAARLMAEDGIEDYGLAKRKAARQLGASETEALPNNAEIESELRAYQTLYQGEEQHARIRELRRTALEVMALLTDFDVCLTGPVLDGTAGRYAGIDLEIFTDDAKAVEFFLLDRHVDYTHEETRRPGHDAPQAVLRLDLDGTPVLLSIYDSLAERTRRRSRSGKPIERARAAAVAALIQQEDTP